MYQNSAKNSLLGAGVEGDGGCDVTSNDSNTLIMDANQQQEQQKQNINNNGMQFQQQTSENNKNVRKKAYVKITEQPASKALRFRYECEGRSAGSIPGVNSTPENKTYPTIEIVGYKGRAVVVVSCITKDKPYRPHPHNLVGKEGCKKGVCTVEINPETMKAIFSNLGIQCVKKKDIEAALKAREDIRVDPYKTGFSHRFQPSSIDLNSVRLCFQVFMEGEQKGRFTQPLAPVVSEPIFDKKAMSDLVICRLCSCSATVLGNTEIMLFCEKVTKEDISVRFYEENNGQTIWEAYGEFQNTDVHKQVGIIFKTPKYHKVDITEPAKVFIQLKRPSDGVTSESLPFEYIPLDSDPAHLRRKRQKTNGNPVQLLLKQHQNQNYHQDGRQVNNNCWNPTDETLIKMEPRDLSPQPCGLYRAPPELTPSPQPLSPTRLYTHNIPTPYNIGSNVPTGSPRNQQFISSNQQYIVTPNSDAGNKGNVNASTPMNIRDYEGIGPQTQQHLQSYTVNNFVGTSSHHWDTKFNTASGTGSNNMNNLNNPNFFTMQNLLTPVNAFGGSGNGTSGTGWNIASNHFQPQHQSLQQCQEFLTLSNTGATPCNNGSFSNVAGGTNGSNGNNEHSISNLLAFDSEQLVHINSEDQQMLRLSSEDLQISNLSIST